jgi:hypothetical protein
MIISQRRVPFRKQHSQPVPDLVATSQFDCVALAIVKSDGLDAGKLG